MKSVADKLVKQCGGKLETESVGGMRTVDVSDNLDVVVNPCSDIRAGAVLVYRLQDDAADAQVPKGSRAESIVDHANDEAACAALTIQRLLGSIAE